MEYVAHIIVVAGIYSILALSLALLVGRAGLLSISHAAFYGVGAYCSALLAVKLGAPFWGGVLAGAGVAAVLAAVIALSSLRLSGDYFAIATFGFQMIAFSVFNNWTELTRGPLGIVGVPRPATFGWPISSVAEFAVLAWAFAALAYVAIRQLVTSPLSRVLYAIREEEVFAQSLGKRTFEIKVKVFVVSAVFAALAGSLYAHYVSYVDPTAFTFMESILVLTMVILGGGGSLIGPVVGAVVLVALPEALRFLGLPTAAAANLRQIIYGALLVLMMMARPQGLVGRYAFGR